MPKKFEFRARDYEDFTILKDGAVYGKLRVKPSGVSWKPKNRKKFYKVEINDFGAYAEEHGKPHKQ